jgi:UDP-N-acetylglucosamine 1-carboxyvinyltransferase
MSSLIISGGQKLSGRIRVAGMKNAVLPLMTACLLTDQKCVLENVPQIKDVDTFVNLLQGLGVAVTWRDHVLSITAKGLNDNHPDVELVRKMRASVLLMGALLVRKGKVIMPYPGGDIIGARPIDIHLRGFQKLGAHVKQSRADFSISGKLKGAKVVMRLPSVLATENLLLAASLTEGTTIIKPSAAEPHVQELANFLNKMGAKISGTGSYELRVEGVPRLHGARFKIIPDQIEAGTFAILGAATRSEIEILDIVPEHLDNVLERFEEMGVAFEISKGNLYIKKPKEIYQANIIQTGYYPQHIPSDLQPPFALLATQAKGTSLIHDPVFEGRLGYINELIKMGANAIVADPHRALITGPTPLYGTEINSLDIRAGITLVIAGLIADGQTIIRDADHIDRGYENIEERLSSLGARIKRVN